MWTNETRADRRWAATLVGLVLIAAACTSSGAGASSAAPAAGSAAPEASADATAAALPTDRYSGGEDDYGSPASPPAASADTGGGAGFEVAIAEWVDGQFLTGVDGMTLYTFKNDSANTSVCDGDCATNWPPATVAAGASATAGPGVTGALTTFARSDGSMQLAYDGAPLYYFAGDSAAGDMNGHGQGQVWFVATP